MWSLACIMHLGHSLSNYFAFFSFLLKCWTFTKQNVLKNQVLVIDLCKAKHYETTDLMKRFMSFHSSTHTLYTYVFPFEISLVKLWVCFQPVWLTYHLCSFPVGLSLSPKISGKELVEEEMSDSSFKPGIYPVFFQISAPWVTLISVMGSRENSRGHGVVTVSLS